MALFGVFVRRVDHRGRGRLGSVDDGVERVEDEYYVTIDHEMTKEHYISFFAAFYDDAVQIVKLYPEGMCEARFKIGRLHSLYCYCNRHGLYKLRRSGFFK